MTTPPEIPRPRRRWLRRVFLVAVVGLGGLLCVVLALPWTVELPFAQRGLAAAATRVLAPSAVLFDHITVSWSRPIVLRNVILRDAQGDDIVASPDAHLSWNLWDALWSRPDPLTLTLDHARVDIERLTDGTIDLLDTLKPVLKDEPDRTILVRIADGTLRFRAAGLKEPFTADKADIDLDLNAYPQPNAWRLKLERARENAPPGKVEIVGSLGRKKGEGGQAEDLDLKIVGERWPWVFTTDEVQARGLFEGSLAADQKGGNLAVEGDARLLELSATGPAIAGDELRLDTVNLALKLKHEGDVWTSDRLSATSMLGKLSASGSYPPAEGRSAVLEGKIDLAALARQLPRTLRLRPDIHVEKGSADLRAEMTGNAGESVQAINVKAGLTDLTARRDKQTLTFRDPVALAALLHRTADSLTLDHLDVTTPFLTATGRGDLDQGISVAAKVDLGALSERLHDWLDMGDLKLAGQGTINARYQRVKGQFEGKADAEFNKLAASGLPGIETLSRERIAASLQAKGAAEPSGLPSGLDQLLLTATGDGEELKVSAGRNDADKTITAEIKGRLEHPLRGVRRSTDVTLGALWGESDVILDPIAVSTAAVAGPGGKPSAGDLQRWFGKGRYYVGKDELEIVKTDGGLGGKAAPFAIEPTKIRLGGLKSDDAAWLEAAFAGDLSRANLGTEEKPVRLAGRLDGQIQGRQNKDGWDLGSRLRVSSLTRANEKGTTQVLAEDASASLRARVDRKFERADVSELAVVTPFGRVEGSGSVSGLRTEPRVDLNGMVSPDWDALTERLAREIEPNASISGSPRAWRLSGTLPKPGQGNLLANLSGELGVNLKQVDVFGMRLGPTPIVVSAEKGAVHIDPIDATLNSGRLHLEPELIEDENGASWVHLGPASSLMDAVVNDEVSHRVLAYAAPVLDQATRVRGRVSLALGHAYFPITGGKDLQPKVDGDVLFDSVEFMPGPLADQIISVFRQERRPLLVLRDPVSVRIIGRTIYQEGLLIPLGNVAVIGIDGTVDFDKNLDLTASFALIPPNKQIPVLSDILAGTQLQVPITGTLDNPRINGDAIAERLKNMGTNMLDTLIGVGVNGLGRILQGRPGNRNGNGGPPRDFFPPFEPPRVDRVPPPPPPRPGGRDGVGVGEKPEGAEPNGDAKAQRPAGKPDEELDRPFGGLFQRTPEQRRMLREERKARRLEKREERRARRGLPPE